jgi:AAA+ superfamily predicted ATPase
MNAPAEMLNPAAVARLQSWTEFNRLWLIAAIARLRQRLESQIDRGSEQRDAIADCVAFTEAAGFMPALVRCATIFGLSPFERELLLLVAGLELDQGLRAAVTILNSGVSAKASYGLALATLTEPHWDALSPDAALRHWHMIEPEPGGNLIQAPLRIDERVLHFVAGVAATDSALAGVASLVTPTIGTDDGDLPLVRRIARSLTEDARRGPIVVLRGSEHDPAARRDFMLAVAAQVGRPALWIEARDLQADAEALALLASHIDREAVLSGAIPVLSIDGTGGDLAALGLAARLRSAFIWLGAPNPGLAALPHRGRVLRFDLPAPDAGRTRSALLTLWQRAAPAGVREDAAIHAALHRAASQFHLGPAALDDILERVHAAPPAERAEMIWTAAREAARGGLDSIAQRIETRASFEDVVLPAGQGAMLRDIARHLRQRERVYREWGFGAQLGQGLVALFAGESGTGKTLAAEAIAKEVELDLYRVDLATLVSKYIGETEKNLKRLFDVAELSGAVLLFDEADALFGKRSEVKDSHDRYANIEVAYLLQRVEAYRGLAVLTTNMKSALDRAFMRRIRFVITFPFPDIAAREQIWRRQFPPTAPLGEIDFAALARLNVAGGNIRSIAVNAAFKAADAGGRIDQAVLMTAAREEFAKLERSMNDVEQRSAR